MEDGASFFTSLIENGQFRADGKGHALLFGEFLLLVPPPVILHMQERLMERLGREEAAAFMADLGRYQIQQAVERQSERYNLENVNRDALRERTFNIFNILGWGSADVDRFDPETGTFAVTVRHPTLPSVYRNRNDERADEPICHFVRGILERDLDLLTEHDITIEETECAATGGAVCVFETPTG